MTMYLKQKTQIYIRMENIGLGYFNSIEIHNADKWRDKLPEYLAEKEVYDKWITMYGTDTFINIVFHAEYFSGRSLVATAHHLLSMVTKLDTKGGSINPFLRKNWEIGSRYLPGTCIYNKPDTAIAHLHAYISGMYSSPLAQYCTPGMPVFELMNESIYNDSQGNAGTINRFDELDNNDGILLVDFVSQKYSFMMTDTFDPTNAKFELPKFESISARNYILAFHPEYGTNLTTSEIKSNFMNVKINKPFTSAMKSFKMLSTQDIFQEWFPVMNDKLPVEEKHKPKGKNLSLEFEDAQAFAKEFSLTFSAPIQTALDRIDVGNLVKVCVKIPKYIQAQMSATSGQQILSERFWVRVTATDGKNITGTIDNNVLYIERNLGDDISFEQKNVYQIQ